jgi:hypothetical protein
VVDWEGRKKERKEGEKDGRKEQSGWKEGRKEGRKIGQKEGGNRQRLHSVAPAQLRGILPRLQEILAWLEGGGRNKGRTIREKKKGRKRAEERKGRKEGRKGHIFVARTNEGRNN